ncbi:MAG: tetratricopeptide repeat protein [Pirellulales bacterium]
MRADDDFDPGEPVPPGSEIPVENIDCGAPWQFSVLTLLIVTALCGLLLTMGVSGPLLMAWLTATGCWLVLHHGTVRLRNRTVALGLACQAAERGDDDRAAAILRRLLSHHPHYVEALTEFIELHIRHTNWPAALDRAAELVEAMPRNARPFITRARLHRLSGNLTAALADCDLALEIAPHDADALHERQLSAAS